MDDFPSVANLSLAFNFTSILSFLPSSLLSRLPKRLLWSRFTPSVAELDLGALPPSTISDLMATSNDWETPLALAAKPQVTAGRTRLNLSSSEDRSLLLGPLGFFTSGYMLGLFLMAFVLHRLHNTMIPSRLSRRGHRHAHGRFYSGRAIIFVRFYHSIFPIDMSRTVTRFILQLPTLYCLLRMLLLWGLIILQTSSLYPETLPRWVPNPVAEVLHRLWLWAARKPMDEVCWISFCSLSAAYFVESFVRKLDELANGAIEEVHLGRQMSPYNLVAHSFVLYLFSLSTSQVYKPDGLPARPDTHALITMGIPLLQSTFFHILCISKKHSNHRLLPTFLTSLLGLIHFHTTLWVRGYPAVLRPLLIPGPDQSRDRVRENVFSGTGFRSSYPLMNYFSCLIETGLILVILLTVGLNALVQLLVNGRVERLLSGLGIAAAAGGTGLWGQNENAEDMGGNDDGGLSSWSWRNLPFEEEWGVVLMRIGTASLEATGLRGWGNEVAPISAPVVRRNRKRRSRRTMEEESHGASSNPNTNGGRMSYGIVRMGRAGVGKVTQGTRNRGKTVFHQPGTAPGNVVMKGWRNEVRVIEAGANTSAARRDGLERERWVFLKELLRFVKAMIDVAVGLVRIGWRRISRRYSRQKGCQGRISEQKDVDTRTTVTSATGVNVRDENELYRRFLRGEDISDDDEQDATEEMEYYDDDESGNLSETESSSDPESSQQEREEEAIALFADVVRNQGVDEGSKMVLSHLVYGSERSGPKPRMVIGSSGGEQNIIRRPPPLTRRRWKEMLEKGTRWGVEITGREWEYGDEDLESENGDIGWSSSRSNSMEGDVDWTERALCIICTGRPREIVSWPCRCLAMCDQCREVLAARKSPGKHHCPCCRQPIEGYSRIFLP